MVFPSPSLEAFRIVRMADSVKIVFMFGGKLLPCLVPIGIPAVARPVPAFRMRRCFLRAFIIGRSVFFSVAVAGILETSHTVHCNLVFGQTEPGRGVMLYWFFVKALGPLARWRMDPKGEGVENIPTSGGGIIASNHLAVIDDALIPLTSPRMVHFMGKAEYFEGKGIKGRFKKWWFTSVGVFPVDREGGSKAEGALTHARTILEQGHLFGIHIEGTRSPDGRLYRGHVGAARLALQTGCPIIPTAVIGSREIQPAGKIIPNKGHSVVRYGTPISVERLDDSQITHDRLRELTGRISKCIESLSGQEYVDEYAQTVKARISGQNRTR